MLSTGHTTSRELGFGVRSQVGFLCYQHVTVVRAFRCWVTSLELVFDHSWPFVLGNSWPVVLGHRWALVLGHSCGILVLHRSLGVW